jgi:hypothetical protein
MPPPPRSSAFAFKCHMGHPLNRLDFNLTMTANNVKQLFYTRENGEDMVCMRLQIATTRTRIRSSLNELQANPRSEFKKPDEVNDWISVIYMGSELREGDGEGVRIMQTLNVHKLANNPLFFESMSLGNRHLTNMLTDGLRMAPIRAAPVVIPPRAARAVIRPVVTPFVDAPPVVVPAVQPALPVVVPPVQPAVVVPPIDFAAVVQPPLNRSADTVGPIVALARTMVGTIVATIPVPGNRVGVLMSMVAQVRTELERQA